MPETSSADIIGELERHAKALTSGVDPKDIAVALATMANDLKADPGPWTILADAWASYQALCIPENETAGFIECVRMGFYAGAHIVMSQVVDNEYVESVSIELAEHTAKMGPATHG